MKRTILLMFACIVSLMGCTSTEPNTEKETDPTEATKMTAPADNPQTSDAGQESGIPENMAAKDNTPASVPQDAENTALSSDFESLTEPPALTVSTPNHTDSVIASCGNYHWSCSLPDGTATELIACGAHPLDEQEHPILYTDFADGFLPTSEEDTDIESVLPIFYLDFGEVSPETVSAIRWPATCIGDAQSHSAEFESVTAEFYGDTIALLPLGDGDYVYEVSAAWGNMGGASYTFHTLPQVQESQKPLEMP